MQERALAARLDDIVIIRDTDDVSLVVCKQVIVFMSFASGPSLPGQVIIHRLR